MRGAPRSVLVVALCCLSITVLVGLAVGAGPSALTERSASIGEDRTSNAPTVDPTGPAQVSTVFVTQEFAALPDRPGHVRVTRRFEIPDNVRTLRTEVPDDTEVTGTSEGFERIDPGRYEWSGGSRTPSLTHVMPVNETGDVAGPEGADGRFLFVDVGDWGLFRRPATPTNVEYVGSTIRFDERATVAGQGVAGERLIYLGPSEEQTRRADGQRFRLVVPRAADLAEPRSEILESVADASTSLRVGQRDDEVLMVAAPTSVDWAVRGLQTGGSDMYVLANERLDKPDNTWLHEYVHTRQDFSLTRETRWLGEATATYYAGLLALEQERIGFAEFRRLLGTGSLGQYESVVLSDQSTWSRGANYRKGSLVVGELDRRLRLATDSGSDFQAVFRALNERPSEVEARDLTGIVARVGTDDVERAARRYTATTDSPTMWDAGAHSEAFGQLPPRIHVSLPEDVPGTSYRVEGAYRNRSLGEPPFVLVPGERLALDVRLTNDGGAAGPYNLSYGVNGDTAAFRTGTLDPSESVTESLSVTVESVGDQTVRIGEHSVPVTVAEPAEPTVTDVGANRTSVAPDEAVGVSVALANEADRPGARSVSVTSDGRELVNRTVRLDANATRTVSLPVRLSERGTHTLTVDDESVTIQVGAGSGGADAIGPGVGPAGAVIAVIAAVALAVAVARARRSR